MRPGPMSYTHPEPMSYMIAAEQAGYAEREGYTVDDDGVVWQFFLPDGRSAAEDDCTNIGFRHERDAWAAAYRHARATTSKAEGR